MKYVLLLIISFVFSSELTAQSLLLFQMKNKVCCVNLENKSRIEITKPINGEFVGYKVISNDSIQLYFNKDGKIFIDTYKIPFDAIIPEKTFNYQQISNCNYSEKNYSGDNNTEPILSPDKKYFVYMSCKYGFVSSYCKLYLVDVSNCKEKFIDKGTKPSFSPNGRYLIYKHYGSDIYSVYDLLNPKEIHIYDDKIFWLYR